MLAIVDDRKMSNCHGGPRPGAGSPEARFALKQ
jgi:hypothetical protein